MSLLDAVNSLGDYLNQGLKATNNAATASTKRDMATPSGQLTTSLTNQTSTNTTDQLKTNPILTTAPDSAIGAISTTIQGMVSTAVTKVNLTPIQNASAQFFTLFASVTSFGTEVAMSLARNTGNNLKAALAKKDAISVQLDTEITALYNACSILLNGSPFFNAYLKAVTQAYILMVTADANLKDVAAKLAATFKPSPVYQTLKFNTSITQLTQARDLLLPPPNTNVSGIRSGSLLSQVLPLQSLAQSFTAAVSIAGITLQIAKLALQYEVASINVNAYINTYLNALNDYIANYKQSPGVNQATIDHITAGTSQLDNLIAQMNQILTSITANPTNYSTSVQLNSYGTVWGVQLTAIIEWLKINPGAGSALLSQTTASVNAYNKSVALITAMGTRSFPGGKLIMTAGQEDAFDGLMIPLAKLIQVANTLVVSFTSKAAFRTQVNSIHSYLQASRAADAQIVAAIQPFLSTKSTISGTVGQGISALTGFANKTGLDRMAGLLTNGNVKDLLTATPSTTTYSGAAVVAVNQVISTLQASPNSTTQQVSSLQTLRDTVQSKQKAQEQYAGRSAASTQGADIAAQQTQAQNDKTLVQTATIAAQQADATSDTDDPVEDTSKLLAPKVTPGGLPSSSDAKAAF